jgi:hypothetical protein
MAIAGAFSVLSFRDGAAGAGPGIQRKFLDSGFAVFDRAPE